MDQIQKDFKDGKSLLAVHDGKQIEIRIFQDGHHLGCCTFQDAQAAYEEKGQASRGILPADKALASRFALLAFATQR